MSSALGSCIVAIAIIAPMMALVPAAPAAADSQTCLPITADGQPIFCADTQPLTDAFAEADVLEQEAEATAEATAAIAESTALSVAAQALGEATSTQTAITSCRRVESQPNGYTIYLGYASFVAGGELYCGGYKITATTGPQSDTPVHVPLLCLTTTETCVGPIDETVQAPDSSQSPLHLCVQSASWEEIGSGEWLDTTSPDGPTSPGCIDVPAVI
jgi:hypothetical protein